MATNGKANGHSNGVQEVLQWKVGLINSSGKYLTAETFGFTINASATGLKKKQTWFLEHDPNEEVVYIKSHLGRYMATDHYGKTTCETEDGERDDSCKFLVEYAKDGSGRWAFQNKKHTNYLGGTGDNVKCESSVSDGQLWVVQLAIQPQVNLRSVIRSRYAVLCDDELQFKEVVPWGCQGLVILHFWIKNGKYSIKVSDGRFLNRDGTLVECVDDQLDDDAKFTLEVKAGGLAFKDSKGYYLSALGSTATMKGGKNKSVWKDELFAIECSSPQVIISSQNGKLVSVKQGVDLSANQPEDEETDEKSVFQMEYEKDSKKWAFRTSVDNKYWSLESFGGIQAASKGMTAKTLFEVETNDEDGAVCIKASNNKYLYNKQTGSILANMDLPESRKFIIRMVNRPFLILKCDYGFVALKSESAQKSEVMCNKTSYEPTFIEPQEDGYYFLKGKNNKYWTVHDDKSVHADGDTGTVKFCLRFHGQSQLTIRPVIPGAKLLKGEPNSFMAKGDEIDASTIWEY